VFPYVSQESSLPLIFLSIPLICLAVRTRDDYFPPSQESSLPLKFLYIPLICLAVRTRDDFLSQILMISQI